MWQRTHVLIIKVKKKSYSIVNSSSNSKRLFHFVFISKGEYFPVTNQNINNGVKLDDNSESKFNFFKYIWFQQNLYSFLL